MRAAVERVLHDVWSHRGIAASLLYPFSLVYLAIARRRAARTTPVELPVPVCPAVSVTVTLMLVGPCGNFCKSAALICTLQLPLASTCVM